MPQLQKQDRPTPEDINDAYRQKYITVGERNDKMRRLAAMNLDELIGEQGMLKTYFTQTIKHVTENWNEFVDLASKHDPEKSVGKNLALPFRLMWREIQLMLAPLTAFGEVNGAVAKHWALDAGAPQGLATVIGIATDVGSGFVPVGTMAKSFAKGVQAIGAAKEAKTAAKAAAAAADEAAKLAQAEKLADDAIKQGLAADGVALPGVSTDALKLPPASDIPKTFWDEFNAIKKKLEGITETKSFAMATKEAEKLGLTPDDIRALFPGKRINDDDVVAYLQALGTANKAATPVGQWVATTKAFDPTKPETVDKFLTDTLDMFSLTTQMRTTNVTGGRVVKYFDQAPANKAINEMLRHWDSEAMAKMDRTAAAQTMAEDVMALANEPGKLETLQVIGADAVKAGATGWQKFREGFSGLLLLRPVTWTRQAIGNSMWSVANVLEKEVGGFFTLSDKKGLVQGEGFAFMMGHRMAMAEASKAYLDAFKVNSQAQGRLDFPIHQIGGAFGRAINFGSDNVRGLDAFGKALAYNGEVWASAFRDAAHLGYKPGSKQYIDYVTRRRIMPTLENQERAIDIANHATFQNELGTFGKAAQRLLQWGPLAAYFPFVKSGMNLVKWGWNRTPGLQMASRSLYEDILAGGTRADMAVARLTLANMFGQFFFPLFQTGLGTGGGPTDPQMRRSYLAAKQPYSFHSADGTQYSFANTAEPGTTPLEMYADFAEIANQLDDMTLEQTATAISLVVSRDVLSNTWWQNAGKISELIGTWRSGESISRIGAELLASPFTAIATGGPLGLAIERELDPVRRESRSFIDGIRKGPFARVFGYSKQMPYLRDGYGDPILVPQAVGSEWLRKNMAIGGDFLAGLNNIGNPFVLKPGETDPIKLEGDRLQIKMPAFPWSTGGGNVRDDFDLRTALPGEAVPVELTPEQRDRWIVIYRNLVRDVNGGIQKQLLDRPEYKDGTEAFKREAFMNYLAKSRTLAKNALLVENVELAKKVAMSSAGKYLPMLQPEQRAVVEADVTGSIGLLDSLLPQQRENLMKYGIYDSGLGRDEELTLRKFANEPAKSAPEAPQ